MKVLALETTEMIGSVAAFCDGNLLLELKLDPQARSAQSLAPAVKTLLQKVTWQPGDVNLVATTIGPGSFTGLRVGVATAKAFAYSVKADILGIDTLETIAAAASPEIHDLSVAVDAQRGQVVTGGFRRGQDGWFVLTGPAELLDLDAWLTGLTPGTFISGPILRKVADRVPDHVRTLDSHLWPPAAAAVARLAARYYAAGRRDDIWTLAPRYSRPSAAEEKRAKRQEMKTKGPKPQ